MNKLIFILLLTFIFSNKLRFNSIASEFSSYVDQLIARHNYYRSLHQNTPNLQKSQELCDIAQAYAETLAAKGVMVHSGSTYKGEWMGENLYVTMSSGQAKVTPNDAADAWYNEISSYNYNNPGYVAGTGHFTQLVWKSTQYVGCGFARGKYGSYNAIHVVCNYFPGGNVNSEEYFRSNVTALVDSEKCTAVSPSKAEDCNNVYSKDSGYLCCYFHFKLKKDYYGTKEMKSCQHYTKEMYDTIEDYWEGVKKTFENTVKNDDSDNKVEQFEIKCQSSSFLKIGFVGLIVALLF